MFYHTDVSCEYSYNISSLYKGGVGKIYKYYVYCECIFLVGRRVENDKCPLEITIDYWMLLSVL